ncbi:MAG TPA: AraC family transcriptional regulator [Acidobacteriaceae bacterium]|nr:AraC family transcriptional regulator [Acidobacteriaceae bacterium]
MLSANVAVGSVLPFPGATSPTIYPSFRRPARPCSAPTLVESGTWGNRMAKHLHLAGAPAISVRTRRKTRLAVTRLRSENGLADRTTPFQCEQAFVVQLHLQCVAPVKLWQHGEQIPGDAAQQEGSVSIMDLQQDPAMHVGGAFDLLQFYVPRAALDEFADENDGCRCETLSWPLGKVDAGLKNLASCLLPVLEDPGPARELYVDHLVFAAHAYIARNYGGIRVVPSIVRGGLAPWQLHRATEMLKANLDGQISLSQVAQECKLSVSHFVRAFKQTAGQPPYRWLLQQRIEAAKELLLHSGLPMVEIALKCGFADQACFIRAFRKLLNITPGEWRRSRMQ